MIRKTIKGGDFKSQMVGELVFDQVPEEGSFNPVTSDAVAKIAGGVADLDAIVPEGASEENKLATAADVAGVQEDVDTIEGKIPSDTSTTNKLVNESGLQDAIDNASESWSTGFTPKGESSVSDLNDLATQSNGDSYIVTDSGTLTDGTLAVVAGDQVAWDATNSVWYKLPQYALKQFGTNEIKNLSTTITSFRTGDVIPVDGPNGPAKMAKDTLLELTAQNAGTINKFYGLPFYSEHVGYVHKSDGHITPASGYHCLITPKIPVTAGQTFTYRGIGRSCAASAVFYDSNGDFLSAWQANTAGYDYPLRETKGVVPAGAATAVFSSFDDDTKPVHFYVYLDDSPFAIESNYDKLLRVKSSEILYDEYQGYMLNTGAISQVNTHKCVCTEIIPVTPGQIFMYKGKGGFSAMSWVFLDSSLTVVSASNINSETLFSPVTIPSGVAYAIFSSYKPLDEEGNVVFELALLDSVKFYNFALENYKRVYAGSNRVYPHSGFLRNNFIFDTNANYHCIYTDYIAVEAGQVFKYKGIGRSLAYSAIYFDSSFNIVGTAQENSPGDFVEITIPSGVAYAVFSSFGEVAKDVVFDIKVKGSPAAIPQTQGAADVLASKTWYACGDSFTHGDFSSITAPTIADGKYAGQLAVYPYLIGNRTLCDVHNIAVNGSTIAQPSDSSFDNVFTKPSTGLLYTTDFSDADLITLYFGINDSHKSTPIGTIDDNDNTTFYGAWNVVLDYLTTNYPSAKIGIIVSNGCDTADYPTATEAIAKKWGCAYLDLDGGVGCQTMLRCSSRNTASAAIKARRYDQQKVSATNGHPNALAHELESTFIETWLKSL